MKTKKFRVLAVFLEATMLAVEDAQVEFELSIGKKSITTETVVFTYHKRSPHITLHYSVPKINCNNNI